MTVRDLLVAGKGHRLNLREKNLEGSYLAGADLREANLTQTQAMGADFSGAKFTGACIEDWNIDADTRFDGVECAYIFQSEKPNHNGVRKRLPYNPDKNFEPREFEKFFKIVRDTVKILVHNGDLDAYAALKLIPLSQGDLNMVSCQGSRLLCHTRRRP